MSKDVIIIGAGIGGLSTAALLGKKGYNVTVLEKNKTIGGRAMQFEAKGFRFDMGPSWYLMPDAFERYYKLFNKKPSDFFKLISLSPQYRIFFSKNEHVDISRDLKENLALFETYEKGAAENIAEYVKKSEYVYKSAMRYFIYKNYRSIFDFFNKKLMFEGAQLKLHKNLDSYISQYTKNDRIKKILEYSTVFLGISPKKAPALFTLLSYVDFKMGVFYPNGGVYKIIDSLEKLCKENGVRVITNQEVEKIIIKNGKAEVIKTQNKTYNCDLVISNADYPFTETRLLEKQYRTYDEEYWKKKTIAPSAFILYLGIKGKVKNLKHHNLFFEHDWQNHFDEIFDDPKWPDKPSFYVSCPSKTDRTVAPSGCENLFVLVPVAPGLNDTDKIRKEYRDKIITELEEITGDIISDRIVFERIFAQRDYKELYNAYKGTALGLAHTFFQSAAFRPQNKSKKVKNLYYVGQYTLPGVGIPMCLIGAEILVDRIKKEHEN